MPKQPKEAKAKDPKQPKVEKERLDDIPIVKGAIGRVGLYKRGMGTLVVYATGETATSPEVVWDYFCSIENWPMWQKPFVTNAKWLDMNKREFVPGARFEITMNWGGSLGKITSQETIKEVDPRLSVVWYKVEKGPNIFGKNPMPSGSCHIWFFEPLNNGGTKISQVEVQVGMRPLMAKISGGQRKYSKMFKDVITNLIKTVDKLPKPKPAPAPETPA